MRWLIIIWHFFYTSNAIKKSIRKVRKAQGRSTPRQGEAAFLSTSNVKQMRMRHSRPNFFVRFFFFLFQRKWKNVGKVCMKTFGRKLNIRNWRRKWARKKYGNYFVKTPVKSVWLLKRDFSVCPLSHSSAAVVSCDYAPRYGCRPSSLRRIM